MTKLLEWLSCASVFFGIWIAAITSSSSLLKEWHEIILLLPVIFVGLFGLYAATIVLYRVFTFNTCESAAIELQQVSLQICLNIFFMSISFSETIIFLPSIFLLANRRSQERSSE